MNRAAGEGRWKAWRSRSGLGLQDKDLGGIEDPALGASVAQCEGKPERFKFPQRTKCLSLCYMAFWHCYFILG